MDIRTRTVEVSVGWIRVKANKYSNFLGCLIANPVPLLLRVKLDIVHPAKADRRYSVNLHKILFMHGGGIKECNGIVLDHRDQGSPHTILWLAWTESRVTNMRRLGIMYFTILALHLPDLKAANSSSLKVRAIRSQPPSLVWSGLSIVSPHARCVKISHLRAR
jgi:hypothetical protein